MATNGNGHGANGNGAKGQSKLGMEWKFDPRWEGVTRPYNHDDVERLRGSVHVEHSLARLGAERLWTLLHEQSYVQALGAVTGNQGRPAGEGGASSSLRQRLASGRRCKRRCPNLS